MVYDEHVERILYRFQCEPKLFLQCRENRGRKIVRHSDALGALIRSPLKIQGERALKARAILYRSFNAWRQ